jgi:hypothetical protein
MQTHLPFLKGAVEACVPDLDQSEFGKGQKLLLLVCCLLKEFLDLRVKKKGWAWAANWYGVIQTKLMQKAHLP